MSGSIHIPVSIDDITEAFCSSHTSWELAHSLIRAIDTSYADVGFTEELAKWALSELKKELQDEFNLQDYAP